MWRLEDAAENPTGDIRVWKGINRQHKADIGEFYDMKNMSSDAYPCLANRKERLECSEFLPSGITNIQYVIEPLDRGDIIEPAFTGIADGKFFYCGKEISSASNEFSNGYEFRHVEIASTGLSYKTPDYEDGNRWQNMAEIFPVSNTVKFSHCYMNNRLFITVLDKPDWGDITELDAIQTEPEQSNVIQITGEKSLDNFKKLGKSLIGQNVYIYCYNGYKVDTYYNVTDVDTVNGTITLNKEFVSDIYKDEVYTHTTKLTIYPYVTSNKIYFDAGKKEEIFHNAQRGICNIPLNIESGKNYTDEITQITYTDCNRIVYAGVEDINFKDYFSIGDMICFANCWEDKNNTKNIDSDLTLVSSDDIVSCIVLGFSTHGTKELSVMYVQCRNASNEITPMEGELFYQVSPNQGGTGKMYNPYKCIFRPIPDIVSVISHKQRLWGVNENGEAVYASAVSDPFTWGGNTDSISDSITFTIDTPGDFKGLIDYGQYLLLMKDTTIQQIHAPTTASTGIQLANAMYHTGCIDIESAAVLANTVYYLGYDGFYAYQTGTSPVLISQCLNKKYKSAKAFVFSNKYYAAAQSEDGYELLVYDTIKRLWHKEDNIHIKGAYSYKNKQFIVTDAAIYQINPDMGNEDIEWMAQTVIFFEDTFSNKSPNEIWVRAKIYEGASINLLVSHDDEEYEIFGCMTGTGNIKVYRIPIRAKESQYYRIKLEGKGNAVVYDLERKLYADGRPYRGRVSVKGGLPSGYGGK